MSGMTLVMKNPLMKVVNERDNRRIFGIEQEKVMGSDDGLDVLQVNNHGSVTPHNC